MKRTQGMLDRVFRKNQLELETFDLIDIFSPNFDEQIEEYKAKKAVLEIKAGDSIIPFPILSRAELNTWSIYCPQKEKLKEYTGIFPIEVIRLLDEVKKRNYFHEIEVWSENVDAIDPVLVAKINDKYDSPQYLLARWGAALKSYDEIRIAAKNRYKENRTTKLNEKIKKIGRAIEDMEEDSVKYFNGENIWDNF